MAQIAVQPFVIKDALLKVGADNYEKHVSEIELRPTVKAEKVVWSNVTPGVPFSEASTPEITWDLIVSYAQDWETVNSLSQYLLTNAGTAKVFELSPRAGVGKSKFTVTATVVPGPIGGKGGSVAVGTVTMACDGQPAKGTQA